MLKNCIFIKSEFIQRYFSRILLLSRIPYTYLAEHLLMTASVCSWFINVRTALFFGMNKTLSDIMKKLIYRIVERQLKNPKSQRQHSKIRKSNNGFKVENDNGPISVFICDCSTLRRTQYISYHVLSDKHIGGIAFISNENKKSISCVF